MDTVTAMGMAKRFGRMHLVWVEREMACPCGGESRSRATPPAYDPYCTSCGASTRDGVVPMLFLRHARRPRRRRGTGWCSPFVGLWEQRAFEREYGLDAGGLERAWARAEEILRDRGEDPKVVVAEAAKNVTRWREQAIERQRAALGGAQ